MTILYYIIIRLTVVVRADIWQLYAIVSPADTMKTRLTYLNTITYVKPRITPNGSLLKWSGYAQKWAHPPWLQGFPKNLIKI